MFNPIKTTVISIFAAALIILIVPPVVQAQDTKPARIGFLLGASKRVHGAHVDRLRQSLKKMGYVDGRNIVLEYRFGNGDRSAIRRHATELVRRKIDLIVTVGWPATRFAAKATKTIPIVVAYASNLLTSGLVGSMAKPGGNVTGSAVLAQELAAKRLELMTETVPGASHIALLYGPRRTNKKVVAYTKSAAKTLRVAVHEGLLRSPTDLNDIFASMGGQRVGALILVAGPVVSTHRRKIFKLATEHRLPTLCWRPGMVRDGCLISYGADRGQMVRQAARYVVKILRGAKPGELPIQRSTQVQIVVNLKTAKALGITIPSTILIRANKVIK
jgi:putative ABC transport system substrate-binding protein